MSRYYKHYQIIIPHEEQHLLEEIKNHTDTIKARTDVKWKMIAARIYLDALKKISRLPAGDFKNRLQELLNDIK